MYIDEGSEETPGGGEKWGVREGGEERQIEVCTTACCGTCTPSVQEKQKKGRG